MALVLMPRKQQPLTPSSPEIIPPPPALPRGAKCKRCGRQAEVALPSHHSNFCPDCFVGYCRTAVQRALKHCPLPPGQPILVAVSGGKDSLAAWSLLDELGYVTKGLHVDLGIAGFSEASAAAIERFAQSRHLEWIHYSLREVFGYTIPEIKQRTRRKICSVCGRLKRQLLNRLCLDAGFAALATGHNLDDEAGRLMGNLIRRRSEFLDKIQLFLPATHPRFPAKMKPLYRLEASEIRHYCRLRGIEPLTAGCPLARGATSHIFQDALNFLEKKMPGTKRDFLFGYLAECRPAPDSSPGINSCRRCGEPCFGEQCSVCNLLDQLNAPRPPRPSAKTSTDS